MKGLGTLGLGMLTFEVALGGSVENRLRGGKLDLVE